MLQIFFTRSLLFLLLILLINPLHAESFTVDNIEVDGIKKISIGTVLTYMNVKVGESFDVTKSGKVIRDLYKTGFFHHISLFREKNTLIVKVDERQSIAEVVFEGNEEVSDEIMEDALKQVGITKGKIYNPKLLEKMEVELQQLYYSLGKYAIKLEITATELDSDRIKVEIDISEGAPAIIRHINLVGNQAFDDEELLDQFKLEETDSGWFASDKYSSAKLAGDLEVLRSFYLDQGYLQFNIDSKQVTITPDKKDINITVNMTEGDQYTVSKINLTGDFIVPESELKALILFREGDVFSRKRITSSINLMTDRLGEEGYAFAKINTIPQPNTENKTVDIRLVINPGDKMTVRNIQFKGNAGTRSEVLRREMRQLEGALFSTSKVKRSKTRLQRLKFISSVDTRYVRVSGNQNQLDLHVTVTERFSGNFTIGAGFSESQGAIFNLGLTHDNVFGTGDKVGITFNHSNSHKVYEFSYLEPYYTDSGISRGFSLRLAETDAAEANVSNYLLDQIKVAVNYSIPLSEYDRIRFELGVTNNRLTLSDDVSDEVRDFIITNNEAYSVGDTITEEEYNAVFASVAFSMDSRNRLIFPTNGSYNSIGLELFAGDLEYFKTTYLHQTVFAVTDDVTFSFKTRMGLGEGIGDTTDLPFYEKYTAGGVRTVRGYDYNSLGPLDSKGDNFGGNFQFVTNSELLFKVDALGSADSFRLGLYLDAGNVFAELTDFDDKELRASVGLSAKWFTLVGPIELSYSTPFNDQPEDEIKLFQFSLGAPF